MRANPCNAGNKENPKESFIRIFGKELKWGFNMDFEIAQLIGIPLKKYVAYMKKNFNAIKKEGHGTLFYRNWQDADRAADWINSAILANKLAGILDDKIKAYIKKESK